MQTIMRRTVLSHHVHGLTTLLDRRSQDMRQSIGPLTVLWRTAPPRAAPGEALGCRG